LGGCLGLGVLLGGCLCFGVFCFVYLVVVFVGFLEGGGF
jgi:hypothetical protein